MRADARRVVDAILPRRGFERSLFSGLVSEGAIVQDMGWGGESPNEEVAYISYERFADHIVADLLIRRYIDLNDPSAAFETGGGLAFLYSRDRYVPSGLIEALCVQVPEHTGQELFGLSPEILEVQSLEYIVRDAFRQSIVWRSIDAFTESTNEILNEMIRNESDWEDTLDVMLTVSTIDKHPFNAERLDSHLRSLSMPDRDAQWSIYSHLNWRSERSVHRLVKWASEGWPKHDLDDRTVDLGAMTLAWTLTSSDRYLRDRATKALVSLLTGRVEAVCRLLRRFGDIEEPYADPYVVERLYAVAYGVAMRSHDASAIECLASVVYDLVFASEKPPAHILLRDYARGVIERSIALGTRRTFDEQLFRPPYCSEWPNIPTKAEIDKIVEDWDHSKKGQLSSWNPVISSMLPERGIADFATYVIGVRSANPSWLSVTLDQAPWKSVNERTEQMVVRMDATTKSIWSDLVARENHLRDVSLRPVRWTIEEFDELTAYLREVEDGQSSEEGVFDLGVIASNDEGREEEAPTHQELLRTDSERNTLLSKLKAAIHPDLQPEFDEIVGQRESGDHEQEPRLDLSLAQNYIIGRVHELGWTDDKFGDFDRQQFRSSGREASKVERIGKKYQWIGYHEILAYIADHFQYRERYLQDGRDRRYDGPWQDNLRDIDPSCMVVSTSGDSSSASWHSDLHTDWGDGLEHGEWIANHDDLPDVSDMVIAISPGESPRWINVSGFFRWPQPTPADYDSYDVPRRDIWFLCTGYLVRSGDMDTLAEWSKGVDFCGRWMPENSGIYGMYLGEHGWSDAYRYFDRQYKDWHTPEHGCPASVQAFGTEYNVEAGFDCSIDEGYRLNLPHYHFIDSMGLKWSGRGVAFQDCSGDVVALDPAACKGGPSALLIREDVLKDYLAKERLELCWVVLGEKLAIGGGSSESFHGAMRLSGFYKYANQEPDQVSLRISVDEPQRPKR